MPPLFEKFYGDASLRKCGRCGAVHPGRKALQPA
jgi:3-hydroxyanthranilate 3,4-dioxygenase